MLRRCSKIFYIHMQVSGRDLMSYGGSVLCFHLHIKFWQPSSKEWFLGSVPSYEYIFVSPDAPEDGNTNFCFYPWTVDQTFLLWFISPAVNLLVFPNTSLPVFWVGRSFGRHWRLPSMMSVTPVPDNKMFRDVVRRLKSIVMWPVSVQWTTYKMLLPVLVGLMILSPGYLASSVPSLRDSPVSGGSCIFGDAWPVGSFVASASCDDLITRLVGILIWMPSSSMVTVSRMVEIDRNGLTLFDSSYECGSWERRAASMSCSGGRSKNTYWPGRNVEVMITDFSK